MFSVATRILWTAARPATRASGSCSQVNNYRMHIGILQVRYRRYRYRTVLVQATSLPEGTFVKLRQVSTVLRGQYLWTIYKQCCGSGMFIPDPNFFYPGSELFPSRMPDSGSASKNIIILTQKNLSKLSEM
jgi:hypothetical protein